MITNYVLPCFFVVYTFRNPNYFWLIFKSEIKFYIVLSGDKTEKIYLSACKGFVFFVLSSLSALLNQVWGIIVIFIVDLFKYICFMKLEVNSN